MSTTELPAKRARTEGEAADLACTILCIDDGTKHITRLPIARMSSLFSTMLDDTDSELAEIPISNVDGPTMRALLCFCERSQPFINEAALWEVEEKSRQAEQDDAQQCTSDVKQLRDLFFDDDTGMSLPKLQKRLEAANFLGIQPFVDAACAVAGCAIDDVQATELATMKKLLLGSPAMIGGRPTSVEVFALLSNVRSYEPELLSKIIRAAEHAGCPPSIKDNRWIPRNATHAKLLATLDQETAAAAGKDRFWTMWLRGRQAAAAELETELEMIHSALAAAAAAEAAAAAAAATATNTRRSELAAKNADDGHNWWTDVGGGGDYEGSFESNDADGTGIRLSFKYNLPQRYSFQRPGGPGSDLHSGHCTFRAVLEIAYRVILNDGERHGGMTEEKSEVLYDETEYEYYDSHGMCSQDAADAFNVDATMKIMSPKYVVNYESEFNLELNESEREPIHVLSDFPLACDAFYDHINDVVNLLEWCDPDEED